MMHGGGMAAAFVTYHLQQGEVSQANVVEVDLDVDPSDLVGVEEGHAVALVVHHADVKELPCGGVDASVVLPRKEIHPHDAEYQPEDEADQQDVHDGGDGAQQGVHHHLQGEKRPWRTWLGNQATNDDLHVPVPQPYPPQRHQVGSNWTKSLSIDPTDPESPENQLGWVPGVGDR